MEEAALDVGDCRVISSCRQRGTSLSPRIGRYVCNGIRLASVLVPTRDYENVKDRCEVDIFTSIKMRAQKPHLLSST